MKMKGKTAEKENFGEFFVIILFLYLNPLKTGERVCELVKYSPVHCVFYIRRLTFHISDVAFVFVNRMLAN